jgi:hypothetical protein
MKAQYIGVSNKIKVGHENHFITNFGDQMSFMKLVVK